MSANDRAERDIFDKAIEIETPQERAAYIQSACGDNSELLERVNALLRVHDQVDFLPPHPGDEEMILIEPTLSEAPGTFIGRYKLLEKIGQGGMAVVYMAEQEKPIRRKVALKIIKLGMDTKQVIARFEAERQALAVMDHPNIAKVLDAGATETGRPYFVMELVKGIPITEYCDTEMLNTQKRLDLFVQVCNAVQHAHQKGIIHRDIKPSNVMVTLHDEVAVPKVIDFGIAKATDQKLTEKTLFTRYAQIIGTPVYMSPEQAQFNDLGIDTRTDIYSLGVLLYELITGSTPFSEDKLREAGYIEMQRVIREEEPLKPSTKLSTLGGTLTDVARHRSSSPDLLRKAVCGDLDWIVMKCLEKDRTRRFETANELATDIKRHLDNEPVVARPPSTTYKLQKAWRRNKVVFMAIGAVVMALLVGMGISVWQARIANAAWERAVLEERQARKSEIDALRHAYNSDMSLAYRALEEDLFGHVHESVRQHVPKPGETDFRGWEWRYAWAQCQSDAVLTWNTPAEVGRMFAVRISFDQRYMVTSGFQTGPVLWPQLRLLWNFQTREELKHIHLPGGLERGFAFSNSGKFLALQCENGNNVHEIHIYDTDTWELEPVIPSEAAVHSLSFSPDEKTLATIGHPFAVLWDWRRQVILHKWPVQSGFGRHDIAFFPDGRRLAIGGADELKIVDVATGLILHHQPARDKDTRLAISPDSRYVAIGSGFEISEIGLLNTDSWEQEPPLKGHSAWVESLTFTPDDKQLISASADQTLRVWDMQRRVTTRVLKGHQSDVHSVSLTSDTSRIVSAGGDGQILEWDLNVPLSPFREQILTEPVRKVVFSADSRFFYAIDKNGSVSVWDANTFTKKCSSSVELGYSSSLILSPEGSQLIVGTESGELWVLNTEDLQVVAHRKAISGKIHPVGFSADGTSLVAVEFGNKISQWNIDTWQLKSRVESGLNFKYFEKARYAIPQKSDILLCVSEDSDLVWWDLVHSEELARIDVKSRGFNNEFAVSPTEPLLASIAEGDFVRLWNWKTREPEGEVRGPRDFHSVAFSPDGRRLVSGSSGKGALRLWDVSTWQEIARLGNEVFRTLNSVQFSPDGNIICAIDAEHRASFLRAPSWESINAIEAKHQTERR